jgi:thiamine pyrophosphate-dependent acetolactate synthase large subunit-like protein
MTNPAPSVAKNRVEHLTPAPESGGSAIVIAHEWTSTLVNVWDRLEITRPGSMYMSAAGGLGSGLPGAIGLQLGDPSRRVVALLGDGAVHYSVSGLWTAAQHNIPVVFVVARNSEYAALKEFTRFMHDPDAPGMELPGMDIPGIAASYGVQSELDQHAPRSMTKSGCRSPGMSFPGNVGRDARLEQRSKPLWT